MSFPIVVWILTALAAVAIVLTRLRLRNDAAAGRLSISSRVPLTHFVSGIVALVLDLRASIGNSGTVAAEQRADLGEGQAEHDMGEIHGKLSTGGDLCPAAAPEDVLGPNLPGPRDQLHHFGGLDVASSEPGQRPPRLGPDDRQFVDRRVGFVHLSHPPSPSAKI